MIAAYPVAANPEPYQILGLKLKPFCLGHCEHMERHVGQVETRDDLLFAIFICSQTYEGFTQFITGKNWMEEIRAWGRACGIFDAESKAKLFNEYVGAATQKPVVVFESEGRNSGTHWIQCVKVALIDLGYSPSQAMNLPLGQAFWDYYKAAENAGVLRILSKEEAAEIERIEREAACLN